jgi:hypothetical protein
VALEVGVAEEAVGVGGCTEVVQCYVRDPPARHARRWLRLVAFRRIELPAAARRRRIALELTTDNLAVLDDDNRGWHVRPGEYHVVCGTSSNDLHALTATMTLA